MDVVGVAESQPELDAAMRTTDPHVVIVALRGSFDVDYRGVLAYPGVRLVTIDEGSGQAYLCERVGTDVAFMDVVKAIRTATAGPPLLGPTPA